MNQIRYACFILIGILTLQACAGQSADTSQSKSSIKGGWLTNVNEAQAQSVKENKSILVYFNSSDTCNLCKRLETNVFATPMFKDWAEKSVVLLEADLVNSNEQITGMTQSLKVSVYPTIWILSITHEPADNRFKVKPKGTIGYQDTPEKFIGMLQGLVRR